MAELRWNPLLATYTMVAANRQKRPDMPKDYCPFCPGSGQVPDNYDIYIYDNDFPVLTLNPGKPDIIPKPPYRSAENYGKCEVILYSPEHTITLPQLSKEHIFKLINVWTERFTALSSDEKIKYIFIFENRGEEVGVTMPHPHGQLYGYPYVPLKLETELNNCKDYYTRNKTCLICDMNNNETTFGKRIITENNSFIAYLPFFTDYPYGVFIVSRNHQQTFRDFSDEEKMDLAVIMKNVTGAFDNLFDRLFPYMMCIHQTPVNCPEYRDSKDFYHFHIEFYPPLRDAKKIKYYASSEMGAWAAANTHSVEKTAVELRSSLEKFLAGQIK
jgi:UDPglucose--hexose-1-phosphate uridylyltransferase